MKKRTLSTYEDLITLGKYEFFNIKFDKIGKKIFFSLRKDKKTLTWVAKPIDSLDKLDTDANTYFLVGGDGVQGIVFRKENHRFRIVPLHQAIKVVPKLRRKFKDRGKRRKRT